MICSWIARLLEGTLRFLPDCIMQFAYLKVMFFWWAVRWCSKIGYIFSSVSLVHRVPFRHRSLSWTNRMTRFRWCWAALRRRSASHSSACGTTSPGRGSAYVSLVLLFGAGRYSLFCSAVSFTWSRCVYNSILFCRVSAKASSFELNCRPFWKRPLIGSAKRRANTKQAAWHWTATHKRPGAVHTSPQNTVKTGQGTACPQAGPTEETRASAAVSNECGTASIWEPMAACSEEARTASTLVSTRRTWTRPHTRYTHRKLQNTHQYSSNS